MKISGFSVERLSLVGSFHSALSVQVLRIIGVNAAGVTRGSEGGRDMRIVFFRSNRIFESNRSYTTQAVTQPNGLQAYRTDCYTTANI